jgi:phosphatidylinositol kinase/protein kinase (PI-3  family)
MKTQVKDRHNGNILIDTSGHMMHIDFGFILGDSPGRNLGWERAPFKLTKEFCDVIGEVGSKSWFEFEHLVVDAFVALQAHVDSIVQLALISLPDDDESEGIVEMLKLRIMTPPFEVRSLIAESVDNFFTKSYDMLQKQQNGIL